MSSWHDVASLEELESQGRVIARIEGREIGVLIDPADKSLRALRNRCPHVGSPLCLGTLRRRERGAAGTYDDPEQVNVLRCPHHGWEFDLQTGFCLEDSKMRVAVYEVKVVDGRVQVLA